jgi:hypothetical protein
MGEVEGKTNGHAPTEPTAIVAAPPAAILPADQTVEQMLARSEKQVVFRKGILKLIAANLEPEDIAIYGEGDKESIHLAKPACKQILSWAGITVQPDSAIQEKRYDGVEGPYIDFEVWATWMTPDGRYYRTMGNRSTYDDFFAKRTKWTCECGSDVEWQNRTAVCRAVGHRGKAEKTTYYLPLSEVDIPSVKQAAITNLWNHVVEDAGLKPSKKELLAVGFKFEEVKDRVKFGNDNKPSGSTGQKPQTSSQGSPTTGAAAPEGPKAAAPASSKQEPPKETSSKANQEGRGRVLYRRKGIVSEAYRAMTKPNATTGKGGGRPYVRVVQNGFFLFCYHDKFVKTKDGQKNILDLIVASKNQFCDFIVSTKAGTNGDMHYIEGANRIGVYQWEDGVPVLPREREPGDEGYQPTDEDIPF